MERGVDKGGIREGKEAGESRRVRCYYFLIELSILESEKEKRAEKLRRISISTLIAVSIITLIAVSISTLIEVSISTLIDVPKVVL